MFHGYDVGNTMLRIGSMSLALHGVDNPDIRYKDSLVQDHADDEEAHTLIPANPPTRQPANPPTRRLPAAWTTRTRPKTC